MASEALDTRYKLLTPVFRRILDVVVGADQDEGETDLAINGWVSRLQFDVPDLDDSDTAELKLLDEDGDLLFASGELAKDTVYLIPVSLDLCGQVTFKVETSGSQTAQTSFKVKITGV